jgi:hypothetical protein
VGCLKSSIMNHVVVTGAPLIYLEDRKLSLMVYITGTEDGCGRGMLMIISSSHSSIDVPQGATSASEWHARPRVKPATCGQRTPCRATVGRIPSHTVGCPREEGSPSTGKSTPTSHAGAVTSYGVVTERNHCLEYNHGVSLSF